jgi:hypothetical protein
MHSLIVPLKSLVVLILLSSCSGAGSEFAKPVTADLLDETKNAKVIKLQVTKYVAGRATPTTAEELYQEWFNKFSIWANKNNKTIATQGGQNYDLLVSLECNHSVDPYGGAHWTDGQPAAFSFCFTTLEYKGLGPIFRKELSSHFYGKPFGVSSVMFAKNQLTQEMFHTINGYLGLPPASF